MNRNRIFLVTSALIMAFLVIDVPNMVSSEPTSIDIKDSTPKNKGKIESDLLNKINNVHVSSALTQSKTSSLSNNTVQVYLILNDSNSVKFLPKDITIERQEGKIIQAHVKTSELYQLENNTSVIQIKNPSYAELSIDDEALPVMNVIKAHSNGMTGRGVKVAIIDSGFITTDPNISSRIVYQKSMLTPPDITGGNSPGNSHGTAVAEIVVAVAPEVSLYLYNVATSLDFNAAVNDAISQNVNVISASLGFDGEGPTSGTTYRSGTSSVANAISNAYSSGIVSTIAAGNEANKHWYGAFQISGITLGGLNLLNFQPSNTGVQKACLPITISSSRPATVILTWQNWLYTNQDYDLYIYDQSMTTRIGASTNIQSGSQSPFEQVTGLGPGNYCILVQRYSASMDAVFHIYVPNNSINLPVARNSLSTPADSSGAITVGAVNSGTLQLESFSSQGSTDDGRTKPDICGPDGVTTSSYGLGPAKFFGTSASAPQVAGIAALELQAHPTLSGSSLRQQIINDASALAGLGTNLCGVGLSNFPSTYCLPPSSGDWNVANSCTIPTNTIEPGNVIVPLGTVLTIPSGLRLNIDFTRYHLLVQYGGGVLVQSGGAIN